MKFRQLWAITGKRVLGLDLKKSVICQLNDGVDGTFGELRRFVKCRVNEFGPTACDKVMNWSKTMVRKFYPLALASMLCISSFAAQASIASAAAIPQTVVSDMADGSNVLLQDVGHRRAGNNMSWERNRYGNRCNYSRGNCRYNRNGYYRNGYYGNGYYNQNPWLLFPLVIGGAVASSNYYNNNYNDYGGGWSNRHVRWCLNRYRSYNPRTNMWLSYSGQYRQCNGPY
jgi:hypothetical protein